MSKAYDMNCISTAKSIHVSSGFSYKKILRKIRWQAWRGKFEYEFLEDNISKENQGRLRYDKFLLTKSQKTFIVGSLFTPLLPVTVDIITVSWEHNTNPCS